MIKKLLQAGIIALPLISFGQDPQQYASLIEPVALKDNLSIIASDAMEGRYTGSRGQKMAAAFIAHHFESVGLTAINNGSYYQSYNLHAYRQGEISIVTPAAKFNTSKDIVFDGNIDSGGPKPVEIVYVGTGSESEIDQVAIEGRIPLVIVSEFGGDWRKTIQKLKSRGIYRIMYYASVPDEQYKSFMADRYDYVSGGSLTLKPASATDMQWIFVSKEVVQNMFGDVAKLKEKAAKKNGLKKLKPAKANLTVQITDQLVKAENVMGFLEGTDKKDEVLLITAHYDHVGLNGSKEGDKVYNGADDDGSGTVTVLQLATAFAKAKKDGYGPRRSILFMTVSGEELGLYGSQYYTDTDPVVPLDKTVVDLNIDMIGRWDPEHKGKAPYVYVIGADKLSSELHEINVRNNEKYTKLAFDYTYNDENHPTNLYKRSDHWNFAKHGVPIVFYFDGIHEDYHKVSDEVDKIDFDLMAKRGQSVFYTAWEIANREARLKVDK